jgi:hypothetical protein
MLSVICNSNSKNALNKLVYEKTIQYKELQDKAIEEAMTDLLRIEDKFGNIERAKDILKAVDTKMEILLQHRLVFRGTEQNGINLNESIDRLYNQN